MPTMGLFCKAYYLTDLRRFEAWAEHAKVPQGADYLFLHENHVVTAGIFQDEDVVFDRVTPAWQAFCREVLEFRVPDEEDAPPAASSSVAEDGASKAAV
jgi:hypothetical protein